MKTVTLTTALILLVSGVAGADIARNRAVARTFYDAFQKRDAQTMNGCYSDAAHFSDPIFPQLNAREVRGMWSLLCAGAKDLELRYSIVSATDTGVEVAWVAKYTFPKTGRKVTNRVHSSLSLRDGKIVSQRDQFDFWRWSAQALGPAGYALGWTPMLRNKVREEARQGLDAFLKQ